MTEHLLSWVALDETGAIDNSNRSRIPVMPAGTYSHPMAGGTFDITEADLLAYAADINDRGDKLSIDYDHSFARGRGSKAAGWFVGGTAKVEGGTLYADVEWTEPAADAIRSKEYRFISPEFTFKVKRVGNKAQITAERVKAAALTNRPFFDRMEPVMLADRGLDELLHPNTFLLEAAQLETANQRWGKDVTQALLASAQSPGTGEYADLARTVLSSIQPDKENLMSEQTDLGPLAEIVGIAADSSVEDIRAAFDNVVKERDALTEKVEDLEKKVPTDEAMKSLIASAHKGEEAANQLAAMTKKSVLDEAVRGRRIVPANRTHFESMYDIDPEGVTKLLAEMPEGTFAAMGVGGGEGEFAPDRPTEKVTIHGSTYDVDADSSRIHEEAVKVLAEAGKGSNYTPDEYVAAASQAAAKLGVEL